MTQSKLEQLAEKLEGLAKHATQGPWEVDSEYDEDALYSGGGGCGQGFKNFFIGAEIAGKWQTLLDTVNSDHKLVEEEYDEDGKTAWDGIGWGNTALIVELVNNLPTILAALRAAGEGWRLIETAPKDGTRVLGTTRFGVEMVKWCKGEKADDYGPHPGWIGVEQDSTCLPPNFRRPEPQFQPTHWRPLPAPPPTAKLEGRDDG